MKSSTGKARAAPPSPLDSHLGFWLRYVSNHVSLRFRQLLEAEGVSVTEWVALRLLHGREGAAHAELMAALGMTKGAASKVTTRLESKGLVERVLADGSARVQRLQLTRSGQRLVPRLAALADANDALFFGHLEATQREELLQLLQDLVRRHGLSELPVS